MEEQFFEQPVETQDTTTVETQPAETNPVESNPQETTTPSEPNQDTNPKTVTPSGEDDIHRQNNRNAQRRIRQRNATNKRIAELEAEIAKLKGKDDDYSKFRQQQLADRIGDMEAMSQDEQTNEFVDRASEFFGAETEQFMQDTYRYADYVNNNEPDLLLYAQREYGPILLHEWYKRMDNPTLRQQWLGMTRYEKNMVLHKYYTEIEKIVTAYNSGKLQAPPKRDVPPAPKTVPIPGGGRQTPSADPTDDFGIEFGKAEARHSRRT